MSSSTLAMEPHKVRMAIAGIAAVMPALLAKVKEVAAQRPQPKPEPVSPAEPSSTLLLPPNLARLAALCMKDQHNRFGATTGVRLKALADGGYRAESTNGRILAIVTGKYPHSMADYPPVPALKSAPDGATEGFIPPDQWTKAFRSLPKRTYKPILQNLAVVLGNNQATLVSTDLDNVNVLAPRLIEGRWPNTDQIVPRQKPAFALDVNAKFLIDLLQAANDFTEGEYNRVRMEFHDPKSPFVIKTRNAETGQDFVGVIVPLVSEK